MKFNIKINSVFLEKLFMESLYIFFLKWKSSWKKSNSELQFYSVPS